MQLEAILDRATRIQVVTTVLTMHAIATCAGINTTDVQCLNLLVLDGPMTPSQLAATMTLSKGGAVTAMIDRLEKAGYLRRTRDPQDRRQVRVEIIEGEPIRQLANLFQPLADTFATLVTNYTDDQIEFLAHHTTRSNNAITRLQDSHPT